MSCFYIQHLKVDSQDDDDDPFRNVMYVTKLLKHCHEFPNTAAGISLSMLWFFIAHRKVKYAPEQLKEWRDIAYQEALERNRHLSFACFYYFTWRESGRVRFHLPIDILQSINLCVECGLVSQSVWMQITALSSYVMYPNIYSPCHMKPPSSYSPFLVYLQIGSVPVLE